MHILDSIPADADVTAIARCLPWRVSREYDFNEQSHINLQEVKESSQELRARARRSMVPSRHCSFNDSHVTMGAWAHGRSSSIQLNGLLRHNIPYTVLGRKEQCHLHLSSGDNPSDDPS
eukprot:6773908-Heterocapsa_arctica.AAC.1